MLRILGKSSSINVRKVLWTCAEIGVAFEREDWGSGYRSTDAPDFLALNPNALVPVLVDGDASLWESNAICRYLAAKHARVDLLPIDPLERAKVEQWMDWQAGELNNAWRYAFMSLVRKSADHADPILVSASVAAWNRHMAILEGQLGKTGGYVAGEGFTLADVGVGLSVNRWMMTPMAHPRFAKVEAYYEQLKERAAFRDHGANGVP